MKATNIILSDIRFDEGTAVHRGRVSLSLTGGQVPLLVDFHCNAAQPRDCPRTLVVHDLLKDAMRQARDLPGLRRLGGDIAMDFETLRVDAA